MKRTSFEADLRERASKRVTYDFLHHRICYDIELAEKLWQAALIERYHLTDQPKWKFEFLDDLGKPIDQRWSTGIGLCSSDHIFALIKRDAALLYPPGKEPETISNTAPEIYGCLDPALWRHALPFVTSCTNYTSWYNFSYVNKASNGYFYGPESPFITAWASVSHLLPALQWKAFGLKAQIGLRIEKFRPWLQLRRFEDDENLVTALFRSNEFQTAVLKDFTRISCLDARRQLWTFEWKDSGCMALPPPSPDRVLRLLSEGKPGPLLPTCLTRAGFRIAERSYNNPTTAPVVFPMENFTDPARAQISHMIRTGYKPPKKIKVKVTVPS